MELHVFNVSDEAFYVRFLLDPELPVISTSYSIVSLLPMKMHVSSIPFVD